MPGIEFKRVGPGGFEFAPQFNPAGRRIAVEAGDDRYAEPRFQILDLRQITVELAFVVRRGRQITRWRGLVMTGCC